MVLQAALAGLLTRLGAGTDIAIGSPIAGRSDAALDELIGFFVNTLVLRTDTSGNPGFRELIGRVRAGNLAAYGHAGSAVRAAGRGAQSGALAVAAPAVPGDAGVRGAAPAPAASNCRGWRCRPQPVATASAKFDLSLGLIERRSADGAPAGIEGVLEYASDLFDGRASRRSAQRLIRLLAAAVADPERALGQLPILDAAERDTILRRWNDTGHSLAHPLADADALEPATLPELFAAQALRTPEAVAVIFEDRALSYAALDAHANRLAHHLHSLGVGPETMVGLCVERSPEMVVGLLGILKAGGAYLPLDPDYPRERLAFMLADAGAPVLVTQAARCSSGCRSTAAAQRGAARRRLAGDRAPARHRAAARARSRPPGLRHLHLGLHRHTQGRRRRRMVAFPILRQPRSIASQLQRRDRVLAVCIAKL